MISGSAVGSAKPEWSQSARRARLAIPAGLEPAVLGDIHNVIKGRSPPRATGSCMPRFP